MVLEGKKNETLWPLMATLLARWRNEVRWPKANHGYIAM